MLPSKGDILCMGGLAFAVIPGNSSCYRSLSNTICTGDELCLLHPEASLEWPVCYKGQPCQAVFVWKTVNLSLEAPHSQKWYIQVNLRETYICGNVFKKNSLISGIKDYWKLLKYQKVKRGSTCTKLAKNPIKLQIKHTKVCHSVMSGNWFSFANMQFKL